jgi:integrase
MACIVKRRNKWVADYRLGHRRFSPSFGSKGEAEVFLRELRLRKFDIMTGVFPLREKSFSEAVKEYLETVTSKKSVRTFEVDSTALDELSVAFPKILITDLSARDIEFHQTALLRKFKPSTVNRRFNTIRHFLRKCVEWNYLAANPSKGVRRISEPPVDRNTLSPLEVQKLLSSLPDWANGPLMLVASTGVRRSEAIKLQWSHVDFARKAVTFTSQKGGVYRQKVIPMTPNIFELLMTIWNAKKRQLGKANPKVDFVFLGFDGLPINPRTFSSSVAKCGKQSGVCNAGIQILRRTLLTEMSEFNQSGSIIQKVAGHSSLTTTQRYLHHDNTATRAALEQIEQHRMKTVSEMNPENLVASGSK